MTATLAPWPTAPIGFTPAAAYDPEAQIARRSRIAMLGVLAMVASLGVASAVIPIGGAVIAQGEIDAATRTKRIAHPTGGVISALYVKNGDHVQKGQILLRLEDQVASSDAMSAVLTLDQLRAQRVRLEAERIGAETLVFPDDTPSDGPGAAKAKADEARLFAIRRAEEAELIAQLEHRIRQSREQIVGYQRQIAALGTQQALIGTERDAMDALYKKGLVTLTRRNQLARSAADLDGSLGSLQAQIATAEARIGEMREQIIQTRETRRSEAGIKLGELNAQLNAQQAHSIAAGDAATRTVVRAPFSGVIDKLAYAASGELVKPGETILEIVPSDDAMMVQAAVAPADVDQVAIGQPVRVRFSTLNSALVPDVAGHVVAVAADRMLDPSGQRAYYPVRIKLDEPGFARRYGAHLRPGVPSEVFLSTGSRAMLTYLTKPIADQMTRAFRDSN